MSLQVIVPVGILVNEPTPYVAAATGAITQYCRVQYMGGEIRCSNPTKIPNGPVKEARIAITLKADAKSWSSKAKGTAGAMVVQEVQFNELVSVSK